MNGNALAFYDDGGVPDHIAVLAGGTLTETGTFVSTEGNVFPVPGRNPSPAVAVSGRVTFNGRELDIVKATITLGDRELGTDLELAEPDIPIDEARRIARHRQREIERSLRDDGDGEPA